jgi:hypothetical protein
MASADEAAAVAPEQPAPAPKEAPKEEKSGGACSDNCNSLGLGVVLDTVTKVWSHVSHTPFLGARPAGVRPARAAAARRRRGSNVLGGQSFCPVISASSPPPPQALAGCCPAHTPPLARRAAQRVGRRTGRGHRGGTRCNLSGPTVERPPLSGSPCCVAPPAAAAAQSLRCAEMLRAPPHQPAARSVVRTFSPPSSFSHVLSPCARPRCCRRQAT